MLLTDQARRKANETLDALVTLGAEWANPHGPIAYVSVESICRMNADKALAFARLIRAATLLERTGALVANIDRMGNLVGWHLLKN